MDSFERIRDRWVHSLPWDSGDYLAIYEVSGSPSNPKVEGWDTSDYENFVVTNVQWHGAILKFETLMPST